MPSVKKPKRAVGGSAAERGLDFQARVSAIVMAHLVAERPMGWLNGVLDDTPMELDAETGGPGDDVRFLASGGKLVELQAKRGLQRGNDLWEALLSLAEGVGTGCIDAGVLAVCPNSSGTIRETLSEDIVRLGNGRSDGLREIGSDFFSRLITASLDVRLVCSRIRIVVISAVDGNREAEATASERLVRVTQDPQPAWRALVEYGRQLIRVRGKGTPDQIYRELSLAGVALKMSDIETRVQLQAAIRDWLHATYAQITILGVSGRVSFEECWLSLDAHLLEGGPTAHEELDKALKQYHEYSYRHRTSEQAFDAHAIGRFINKCVVLGGPGIGKSTLLKKLALEYSRDGFVTLLVRLPQIVARAREGCRFEDSLVDTALSGSGLRVPSISLDGAVVLCDGLDECGSQQPLITAALHAFSIAHPSTRVVVSSRPIGYRPGEIADWRHYELQPLKDTEAEEAISRVLRAISFPSEPLRDKAIALAKEQLRARTIKGAASRSPLMLTLIAALSAKGIDPGSGKAALYRQLFQLIEDHPPARLIEKPPSEPERRRFLELLGWSLLAYGNEPAEQTLRRCAQWWNEEMGSASLASEARVLACCDYWECLGVVERVRTLSQEAITFVHKTFGEFAAARYISKCNGENQRALIARAIQTPEWKETLSFASHLGLASFILEVWAELATDGDSKAGYGLDEAMELVVQSGVPITESAIEGYAACCWKVVGNSASRTRYAAGEALCIVSKEHWSVIRLDTLKRLEDPDNWSKLVAWACLSVSTEQNILLFPELVAILRGLNDLMPSDSHLGGLTLAPTGNPVRQHLILGAAKRILLRGPDPDGLDVLRSLLDQADSMSLSVIRDLSLLFKEFGLEPPQALESEWAKNIEWLIPTNEAWNREVAHFLEVVDDSSVSVEVGVDEDLARCWELGALLTASGYWQMSAGESLNMTSGRDAMLLRRMVMHGVMKAAGLDRKRLVQQARFCRGRILDGDSYDRLKFFDLPRVDVNAQFEDPVVGVETIGELEQAILGGGEFFPLNAGKLLYGLHDSPEYAEAIERLLKKGRGESMRISAALADSLPEQTGQPLLLKRLCAGELTSGCRYLYERLKPPFDARHVDAMQRGLEGNSAQVAKAAAGLAAKLALTTELASQLRTYFVQWMTKEEPYPKKGGIVPDSPRDALANILVVFFADDHEFLIGLAKDDRPDVRTAAREPILRAAAVSSQLRKLLTQETELNALEPALLRSVIAAGLYSSAEAPEVVTLLQSSTARVRYAALPILDPKFLPVELVRAESKRLLADTDMDIREAASRALRKLSQVVPRT